MESSVLMIVLLLPFLGLAVWIDHRAHRIPNWLSGGLLLVAIAAQSTLYGLSGLGAALGGMLVGFSIFMILYLKGGMAAGDVKLMAAVGACLGPASALMAAAGSLAVGGGIALLLLTYRHYRDATATVDALLTARFPYASAIAVGTAATLVVKGLPWTP